MVVVCIHSLFLLLLFCLGASQVRSQRIEAELGFSGAYFFDDKPFRLIFP